MCWLHDTVVMPRGGASAYCNRVVCQSVSLSFTSISRRSLKTKRWNKQHKQVSIFARTCIEEIGFEASFASHGVIWIYTRFVALAGDLDFSED